VNRSGRPLALLFAGLVVVAGCGSSGALDATSPRAVATPGVPGASLQASTEPASAAPSASAVTQSDTAWGRIWDTLPTTFPTIAGATVSEEAATGAASAVLTVNGQSPKDVAALMQRLLSGAGYSTIGLTGPLENGGYVVDMAGRPQGCKVQVTTAPTGSVTTVTVLYGATCPHD
jgi:hypothetical protein